MGEFKSGYYAIRGAGLTESENDDQFLWLQDQYSTPLEQAKVRWACEMRKQIREDLRCEALFYRPEPATADWDFKINPASNTIIVSGDNHWAGEYQVIYLGDENYFSTIRRVRECKSPLIQSYLNILTLALAHGDDRVRLSKRGDGVTPMFSEVVQFPRWRENGEFWSSENQYLAYDDESLATEQMKIAGFI